MTPDHAAESAARDLAPPWLEGTPAQTGEDLVAEGLALVALLFSVTIGIVIALLPVSGAEARDIAAPAQAVPVTPLPHTPHRGVVIVSDGS
ncbi:MAG: hypothetical protein ACTHL8_00555 [Burkholderiaceae bacterium]